MNDLTPIAPQTNAEVYRASTNAAGMCREIVLRTAQNIQGRKYVKVEGWQAIAIAHGCVASADFVERVEDDGCKGFRALGTIRRMSDGVEISRAEGFLGDDEGMWAKRPVYARRAMAQTRAISRACRSAFAHVVVLIDANLSTTPAEEMEHLSPAPAASEPAMEGEFAPIVEDRRLSAFEATRQGIGEAIKKFIDGASGKELDIWEKNFDRNTAHVPLGWLTSIRDRIELRREELNGKTAIADGEAELDAGFLGAVGPASAGGVARRPSEMAAE